MKNLKPIIEKIDDLESFDIPKEGSKDPWYVRKNGSYHPVDNIYPWERINRICKKFLRKSFDKAFSEYCKQVPKYQQYQFIEYFNDSVRYDWQTYYLDKQNNIQKRKTSRKRTYTYYSDDYKTALVHKTTKQPYVTWKDWKHREDYVYMVVQGFSKEFTWTSPEYLRLHYDQIKRKKKLQRELDKQQAEITYSFLSKSEKEEKESKEANEIKILKHGFDPETSFRGNSVNPDKIKQIRGY